MPGSAAALDVVLQVGHGVAHVAQQALRALQEQTALGGERHLARVAVEEARAQRALQAVDQRAEGRLRQVAARGSAREVAFFGQHDEGVQVAHREVQRQGAHRRGSVGGVGPR
jgi:hypothetical protein